LYLPKVFLWFLYLYGRREGISAVTPGHPDVINESNNSHENYCTTYINIFNIYYIHNKIIFITQTWPWVDFCVIPHRETQCARYPLLIQFCSLVVITNYYYYYVRVPVVECEKTLLVYCIYYVISICCNYFSTYILPL